MHTGTVFFQRITQGVFDIALVFGVFHVDEVNHHQAAHVAQTQLAGDFFGTPLRFIYGHDAFALRDPTLPGDELVRAIEIWHNNGRAVYWIGDPMWLAEHDLPYRETTYTLQSQRLEESYERKPSAILQDVWTLRVARIAPEE